MYATLMESGVIEPSGRAERGTRPGRTRRKPKDLSACESEECGYGEGGGMYPTLMESDAAVEPSGRTEGDTRTGRTRKKPKDLSACESEERGSGGWGCVTVLL
jgi:hypothetical protein